MKNTSIICCALFVLVMISGCKKEPARPDDKLDSSLSLLAKVEQSMADTTADFQITVSSTFGVSVYGQESSSKESSTVVFAQSLNDNNHNAGTLSVNGLDIPFNGSAYSMQCDTAFPPSMLVGRTDNYRLWGKDFPSFNIDQYSPEADLKMTFEGIVADKLPRESALTLNWNPDGNLPANATAVLIIFAEQPDTREAAEVFSVTVNDHSGTYTISASDLARFEHYPYFKIFYVRGYHQVHKVAQKKVDLRYVTLTDAWINFSK